MATITLKGNEIHTSGELPSIGATAPAFTLTASSLEDRSLKDYAGKKKILTINPSLDTRVCAATARSFNQRAGSAADTVVLVITGDLPFAQSRFCSAEGLANVTTLSTFRSEKFLRDYGLLLTDGPLRGLPARAVIVIDEKDRVVHAELVSEIGNEPSYDAALASIGV